jgi:hypothetical protein
LLLAGAAHGQSDVEAAKQTVLKAWANTSGYAAEVTQETILDFGPVQVPAKGTGRIEYLKVGDKALFDVVLESKTDSRKVPSDVANRVHIVSDGEQIQVVIDMMGEQLATRKTKPTDVVEMSPPQLFEALAKNYIITLLPSEYVSGYSCLGFRFVPTDAAIKAARDEESPPPNQLALYFEKNSGILLKRLEADLNNDPVTSAVVDHFMIGPPLDPAKYKLVLPEGAQLLERE